MCVKSSSLSNPKSINSFTITFVASLQKLMKAGSSIAAYTVVAYFSFFPNQPSPFRLKV